MADQEFLEYTDGDSYLPRTEDRAGLENLALLLLRAGAGFYKPLRDCAVHERDEMRDNPPTVTGGSEWELFSTLVDIEAAGGYQQWGEANPRHPFVIQFVTLAQVNALLRRGGDRDGSLVLRYPGPVSSGIGIPPDVFRLVAEYAGAVDEVDSSRE